MISGSLMTGRRRGRAPVRGRGTVRGEYMYYTSNIQYSSFWISSYIILNGQGNAALQGKVSISESDKCPSSCASVFLNILVILRFAMRIKFLFVGCGGWICWFGGLLGFERLELKKGGLKGCDIMDRGCNFYPYSWTHLIIHLIWISLNPIHLNIWIKWVKTYHLYILKNSIFYNKKNSN